MTSYTATGVITNGRLKIRRAEDFERGMLRFRDGDVVITVARVVATRSEQQNRYYFGVVLKMLGDRTGHTVMELHEYCKRRFNPHPIVIVDANGEIRDEQVVGGTTTALNKITFSDYMQAIVLWAAEDLQLTIPPPDPDWQTPEVSA